MKVYLVIYIDWSAYDGIFQLSKVFGTRESAEAYLDLVLAQPKDLKIYGEWDAENDKRLHYPVIKSTRNRVGEWRIEEWEVE